MPRAPWVNPARRVHVAGLAIVLALLFGGGGLLVGFAAGHHADRGVRIERGYFPGRMFPNGGPRWRMPGGGLPDLPTPTPSPSGSVTR